MIALALCIIAIILVAVSLISIPIICPKCGGKMHDVGLCDGHIVYKCDNCGTRWL